MQVHVSQVFKEILNFFKMPDYLITIVKYTKHPSKKLSEHSLMKLSALVPILVKHQRI